MNIFDEYINRRNTCSVKYDFFEKHGKAANVIPMWVADMDFRTLPEVTAALCRAAEHGVFGYSEPGEAYSRAVCGWYRNNFNWDARTEWNVTVSGVVFALAVAVRAFTAEGDGVLVQQPVYHPFMRVVSTNNRRLVVNRLKPVNGRYEIDFDDFEARITQNNVRLFILCSPHNPVGRVWTKAELVRMGEICQKHGVYVASDEIHSDFVYAGNSHTVFADAAAGFAESCVVCTAPTKTFNLAGLQASNIFIPNAHMRRAYTDELERTGFNELNTAAIAATEAAYTYGRGWLDELLAYLQGNIDCLADGLRDTDIGP